MKLMIPALALLLSAATAQDGTTDLRWKFQKDQELLYKSTQKTSMVAGGQGIKQEMSTTISMTVTEVDEKGAGTITARYVALSAKSEGPQEYDYDSEKDKEAPTEPPLSLMARLVGQSFTLKMSASGRVLEVKGFDKILDTMVKGDENAAAMMKQMFSDEAYKGMMQQMTPPLPEGKVAKGATWANDFSIKMPFLGNIKFCMNSTLTDIKDQNALVDQEITIELKPGDDKDNPMAGMVEIKNSKGKSTSVFSIERGCFLSQKGRMEMTLSAGGQEMPLLTESEFTLVEKKKNP
jgi:hypothetical protein